jgi:hypothetical protein
MENTEQLRKELLKIQKKRNNLVAHDQRVFRKLKLLFEAETNEEKRKELIDYLFADKVEEVFEYHFRTEYLK